MSDTSIQALGFSWFLEQTDHLVFMLSKEGKIITVNPAVLSFYGWDTEQIIGKNYFEICDLNRIEPALSSADLGLAFKSSSTFQTRKTIEISKNQSCLMEWSFHSFAQDSMLILMGKYIYSNVSQEQASKNTLINLDTLISCMPGNVYWMDKNCVYLGCNDNVLKTLGLASRHEIIGKTYDGLSKNSKWKKPQWNSFKKDDSEVINTGQPKLNVEEPPISDANGNIIYFLTSRVPLWDENHQIQGVLGISIDITERKKMENDLRQAKEAEEQANQNQLEFLAALNKEVVGTPAQEYRTAEEYAHAIRHHLESVIACMPGNVYWMDKNFVYLGCNDNAAKLIGLESHRAIIGKTYDDFAKIGNWNQDQASSFKKDDMEVMTTSQPKLNVEEPPIIDANGKKIQFLTSRVPIKDEKGQVTGVVGISIDITERKKMENDLRQAKEAAEAANAAKIQFLENMRHDIRTPLIGIVGFSDIIKDESNEPKIKNYAEQLTISSKALLDFLNEILESIRVASGEVPLLKKKFNLKTRIENVIQLNQAKAAEKKLDLQLDYDERIPDCIIGDPIRMHRIILELVTNALNFTHQGRIKISAQLMKKKDRKLVVKIMVADTGIGIEKEMQSEIYTRFKRIHPSYEGIYKGAGLGLSIVKQFIDELEAEIDLESQLEKGTTFICVFPLKECLLNENCEPELPLPSASFISSTSTSNITPTQPAKPNPENTTTSISSPEPSKSSVNHILIVEDQAFVAMLVKNTLSELGCEVDIAPDGHTALELAQTHRYDLIFMDIGLPDTNGYEVTKQIRAHTSSPNHAIPIIGLTAHVDSENHKQCIDAGMNVVLNKPLMKPVALNILNTFIKSQL